MTSNITKNGYRLSLFSYGGCIYKYDLGYNGDSPRGLIGLSIKLEEGKKSDTIMTTTIFKE